MEHFEEKHNLNGGVDWETLYEYNTNKDFFENEKGGRQSEQQEPKQEQQGGVGKETSDEGNTLTTPMAEDSLEVWRRALDEEEKNSSQGREDGSEVAGKGEDDGELSDEVKEAIKNIKVRRAAMGRTGFKAAELSEEDEEGYVVKEIVVPLVPESQAAELSEEDEEGYVVERGPVATMPESQAAELSEEDEEGYVVERGPVATMPERRAALNNMPKTWWQKMGAALKGAGKAVKKFVNKYTKGILIGLGLLMVAGGTGGCAKEMNKGESKKTEADSGADMSEYDSKEILKNIKFDVEIGGENHELSFEEYMKGYQEGEDPYFEKGKLSEESFTARNYDPSSSEKQQIKDMLENGIEKTAKSPEMVMLWSHLAGMTGGKEGASSLSRVNELADTLKNGDKEAYNAVANDFYEFMAESLGNGRAESGVIKPGTSYGSFYLRKDANGDPMIAVDQDVKHEDARKFLRLFNDNGDNILNTGKAKESVMNLMGIPVDRWDKLEVVWIGDCSQIAVISLKETKKEEKKVEDKETTEEKIVTDEVVVIDDQDTEEEVVVENQTTEEEVVVEDQTTAEEITEEVVVTPPVPAPEIPQTETEENVVSKTEDHNAGESGTVKMGETNRAAEEATGDEAVEATVDNVVNPSEAPGSQVVENPAENYNQNAEIATGGQDLSSEVAASAAAQNNLANPGSAEMNNNLTDEEMMNIMNNNLQGN